MSDLQAQLESIKEMRAAIKEEAKRRDDLKIEMVKLQKEYSFQKEFVSKLNKQLTELIKAKAKQEAANRESSSKVDDPMKFNIKQQTLTIPVRKFGIRI